MHRYTISPHQSLQTVLIPFTISASFGCRPLSSTFELVHRTATFGGRTAQRRAQRRIANLSMYDRIDMTLGLLLRGMYRRLLEYWFEFEILSAAIYRLWQAVTPSLCSRQYGIYITAIYIGHRHVINAIMHEECADFFYMHFCLNKELITIAENIHTHFFDLFQSEKAKEN